MGLLSLSPLFHPLSHPSPPSLSPPLPFPPCGVCGAFFSTFLFYLFRSLILYGQRLYAPTHLSPLVKVLFETSRGLLQGRKQPRSLTLWLLPRLSLGILQLSSLIISENW